MSNSLKISVEWKKIKNKKFATLRVVIAYFNYSVSSLIVYIQLYHTF